MDASTKLNQETTEAKQRTRILCCFKIQSKWSIQNQILISLMVLTSITFLFVSIMVFSGLFLTKHYIIQLTQSAIRDAVVKQYTYEAELITSYINITNQYQPELVNTYTPVSQSQFDILPKQAASLIQDAQVNSTVFYDYEINGTNNFVAGYVGIQDNTTFNYTILLILVPADEALSVGSQLESETQAHFDQNFYTTLESIGSAFLICFLIGWITSYQIIKPLKQLARYAQQIHQNTIKSVTKKKITKIDLKSIHASDKIGDLVEVFKNLIQGLAGLKKKNIQKKNDEVQSFFEGNTNQHQREYQSLEHLVRQIKYDYINL